MKLSKTAIINIKANRRLINLLALEADAHSGTIDRYIKVNENDGELTKTAYVNLISKETGLKSKEILIK